MCVSARACVCVYLYTHITLRAMFFMLECNNTPQISPPTPADHLKHTHSSLKRKTVSQQVLRPPHGPGQDHTEHCKWSCIFFFFFNHCTHFENIPIRIGSLKLNKIEMETIVLPYSLSFGCLNVADQTFSKQKMEVMKRTNLRVESLLFFSMVAGQGTSPLKPNILSKVYARLYLGNCFFKRLFVLFWEQDLPLLLADLKRGVLRQRVPIQHVWLWVITTWKAQDTPVHGDDS